MPRGLTSKNAGVAPHQGSLCGASEAVTQSIWELACPHSLGAAPQASTHSAADGEAYTWTDLTTYHVFI